MPRRKIDLVIFDLGRVMIRLCDGWAHACQRAGVVYRPEADTPQVRRRLFDVMMEHEVGRIDDATWARRTAEVLELTPEQTLAVSHQWLDGPFPGWHDLLDRLQQTDARTACLSNTNAIHWKLMAEGDGPHRLPLERLTYRFASHLIGEYKPNAAIYRHVERATGVGPRAILFFDDAGPNVLAARECGWAAQVIEPTSDPVSQITQHLIGYGVLR